MWTLAVVLGAFALNQPADAALSSPVTKVGGTPDGISQLWQARQILDQASFFAFEGASTVQKIQTISLDTMSPDLLKEYMASVIYIPQAIALPSDEEALDEPWEAALIYPTHGPDGKEVPGDTELEINGESIEHKVLKLLKPVQNALVSSPFGFRWGRPHQGVDLAAPTGTPILAAESGKVVYTGWKQGYGNFVAIDHGYGYRTHYAHCSKILVRNGQQVKKGQLIAKVGSTGRSTGPHLHFEVVAKGVHQNPQKFINNRLTLVKSE